MVGKQGDHLITRGDSHLWDDPPFGEDEFLGEVVSILRHGRAVALHSRLVASRLLLGSLRHSELCTRIVLRLRRAVQTCRGPADGRPPSHRTCSSRSGRCRFWSTPVARSSFKILRERYGGFVNPSAQPVFEFEVEIVRPGAIPDAIGDDDC